MVGWGMTGFQPLTSRPQARRKLVLTNLTTHTPPHTRTHGLSIHRDTHSPLTHELTDKCLL